MTTVALRKYLVSKINLLDDDAVLDKIKKIVDQNEKKYVLSDHQLALVNEAKEQIKNGDFITQEELDKKVEEWARKK